MVLVSGGDGNVGQTGEVGVLVKSEILVIVGGIGQIGSNWFTRCKGGVGNTGQVVKMVMLSTGVGR